jgi:centrosomal protein CEP104
VIYASGEDPEFPLSELDVNTPKSRGWSSAKFCEFPQEVVLQFTPSTIFQQPFVRLREVQIITH